MATVLPTDLTTLEDTDTALPEGIRFIPEKKYSDYEFVYPNPYQGTAMFFALVSLLLAKHVDIGFALFIGCVPLIVFFIGIQDQRDKRLSKHVPLRRTRRGILIGSDEIAIFDWKEWRRINRSHQIDIEDRYYSDGSSLHVSVNDENPTRPIRISPRYYDLGRVLAELEDWMTAKSIEQRDPTDAERNGQWLELLNDLNAYRNVIPNSIYNERPRHPFTTKKLRNFAEKLREFEPAMKRRDRFVTGRTIVLGLGCIGGLSALGVHDSSPWIWAYLIGPILFCAWVTWGRLKTYHQDKSTKVFGGHFFWVCTYLVYAGLLSI